jgi:hypothetical protein
VGYRSWFLLWVIVASAQTGCGTNRCSGTYNCPAGGGEVIVPANLPAPISSVTADAPCFIASVGPYTGGPLVVNVNGSISASTTVTCLVHARLSDGSDMVASLSFQALPCCGTAGAVGAAPTLAFVDAGVVDAASAGGD